MSIQQDDIADTGMSDSAAVEQLLAGMTAPKAANGAEEDDEPEEGDEDQEVRQLPADADAADEEDEEEAEEGDEDDQEAEEGDEDDQEAAAAAAEAAKAAPAPVADDAVVKVLVDGQEQELTVGSLKRLAGQEASLTRKSQEADVVGSRAAAVLHGALGVVLEDLEPYKNVDWVLAGHQMDPEEFAWHRENYTRLQGRYEKLVGAAQEFDSTVTARKVAQRTEQAKTDLQILQDPEKGIKGWNDELHGSIMKYGIAQGLDENDVAQISNPSVMKLLHKAMQFDQQQAEQAQKRKVAGEKINGAPRRVRSGGGREAPAATNGRQNKLEQKLRSGRGNDDDAMAALLGRWGVAAR